MQTQKEELFFSEKDFSDKQEWQDYTDHILKVAQEKCTDSHALPNTGAEQTQAN